MTDKVDELLKTQKPTPFIARRIIEQVGGQGTPPEYGFQYFTVGLEDALRVLESEYIGTFIKEGGSAFKLIEGAYGGGKTHMLYCIRELAWKYNFLTSYIVLSPEHTPFYKLEEVYKEIVNSLMYHQDSEALLSGEYERGIESVIKVWFFSKYKELSYRFESTELRREITDYLNSLSSYESLSFRNAMKEMFLALLDDRQDDFYLLLQWIKGENPPKKEVRPFGIYEKIDKTTAFKMIRSLIRWIREIGYSGMVVLLDEAEQTPSMTSKQKHILLNNLRELIDECGRQVFRNTMWFYAVPDINHFINGRGPIYEALNQRLSSVFDPEKNPSGVRIVLDKFLSKDTLNKLIDIGRKLAELYKIAHNVEFDKQDLEKSIRIVAETTYRKRFIESGLTRIFVQWVVKAFNILRIEGRSVTPEELEQ